jgi:Bacterial Ig domain
MPLRTDSRRPGTRGGGVLATAVVLAAVFVTATPGAPRPGTALTTVTPVNGSTVAGTVVWQVAVSGRVPSRVDFFVDGAVVGRDGQAPFTTSLDTARLSNGVHTLTASSRAARAARTTVTVANAVAPQPQPPGTLSPPLVVGTPVVGSTLTGSNGTWSGSTPMTYTYNWLLCDATGATCAPITGATAPTYTVGSADVGRALRLSATATNVAGSKTAMSSLTAVATRPTDASCERPYTASSPWNTPIEVDATLIATSGTLLGALGDDTFTSQPLEYAYPVYVVGAATPATVVTVRNTYSEVAQAGTVLTKRYGGVDVAVRLPADARASQGSDGHIIVHDPETGDEWGFWQAAKDGAGNWVATNGYHYNTHWSGVPPTGFGSRGAGVTYLAGLIRACEIAQGRIDHALAFAYNYPKNTFVYPATKSDGLSTADPNLPEGARLQLDPSIPAVTIQSWGCTDACLVIARAMQVYGMYVVDNSGRDKVYTEDDYTAHWNGAVSRSTLSVIPKAYLRWVASPR